MKHLQITRGALHHHIYVFSLALLVGCLPLSRYILSISQFLLMLNWLAEGGFEKKMNILRRNPSVLIFCSILLVYLAGILYSSNITGALVKVKNVLPIAVLSIIIATSKPLDLKKSYGILLIYTLAVTVAALICLYVYLVNPSATTRDFRKISLFIPHIRFALLIIMAIMILLYQVIFKPIMVRTPAQVVFIITAIFLFVFLFVLRSFAGIIIFFLVASCFFIRASLLAKGKYARYFVIPLILLLYILIISSVTWVAVKDFSARAISVASLDKYTINGNPYDHKPDDHILENGNYVNLYVCEPELRKEWNIRSRIRYDSIDYKGQPIRITLRRYLASKGLRKDSAGLSQLKNDDIQAIEKGRANFHFRTKPGFYQRLYETLWEIHIWRQTGFVSYHSFGQRIVFFQTAGEIIRNNLWTGVGTGDVYSNMILTTRQNQKSIERKWKGEPHNQYAFFLMAFGLPGFIWILFSWIYPVYKNKSSGYLLFNLFVLTMIISMTVLDTIESYDNMVFFAFFYSLFVFGFGISQKKPDSRI